MMMRLISNKNRPISAPPQVFLPGQDPNAWRQQDQINAIFTHAWTMVTATDGKSRSSPEGREH